MKLNFPFRSPYSQIKYALGTLPPEKIWYLHGVTGRRNVDGEWEAVLTSQADPKKPFVGWVRLPELDALLNQMPISGHGSISAKARYAESPRGTTRKGRY